MPPSLNLGTVASANCSGRPSTMPWAPATRSVPGVRAGGDQLRDDALAVPARLVEDPPVLGSEHEDGVEAEHELRVVDGLQARRERPHERLGLPGLLVDDAARSLAGEHRQGVGTGRRAARLGERRERRVGMLAEAERELARVAVGGPVDALRAPAADVAHDELDGAPDRQVGAVALPERVAGAVHPDRLGARPAADDDRADRHRRRQHAVDVELVVADRLDRREHPWQVLGEATGHHGGDGDLLDGDVDEVWGHRGDDVLGVAGRALEHPQHPLLGRRHDRQAVGPAPREHRLELVLQLGELDAAASGGGRRRSARAACRRGRGPRSTSRNPAASPGGRHRGRRPR